ncbi:MAG: helix-turn-helix domain-containing protein [Bacteroidetes bacterium]|nr:helix-turn-helix domain-containing protein [Bacteroidota bacterium]
MKYILEGLEKAFESRARLGIMSVLMVNDWVEFTEMKEALGMSDGNVASHIQALEKLGYVHVRKEFRGKKPVTSYAATLPGKKTFENHLDALEKLINTKD